MCFVTWWLCNLGTIEYTEALEKEIKELKAKCRNLEERLDEASKAVNISNTPAFTLPVSPDNAYLQNHIRSLNETIGDSKTVNTLVQSFRCVLFCVSGTVKLSL